MAMEDLPRNYDAIILGTGMPESILAAALARIGMKVLHLDRNDYYSGGWATLNWMGLNQWVQRNQEAQAIPRLTSESIGSISEVYRYDDATDATLVEGGETLVKLPLQANHYANVKAEFHCPVKATQVPAQPPIPPTRSSKGRDNSQNSSEHGKNLSPVLVDQVKAQNDDAASVLTPVSNDETDFQVDNRRTTVVSEDIGIVKSTATSKSSTDGRDKKISLNDDVEEEDEEEVVAAEAQKVKTEEIKIDVQWTQDRLAKEWRKFNIDLAPKLLLARGSMVDLLVSSDIAKYADFRIVSRILTYQGEALKHVPCCRADVFNSKEVSVLEKRLLMKFLTFCIDCKIDSEENEAFSNIPFEQFLTEDQKLTPVIKNYVMAIAMAPAGATAKQGLKRVQSFLFSLGRYGNTPYLWTMYGSGELPQCFCRMCAVFGGIYILRKTARSVILDSSETEDSDDHKELPSSPRVKGIICTGGMRFTSKWLVAEASYAPDNWITCGTDDSSNITPSISRGVYMTDGSICPTEDNRDHVTLLNLPSNSSENPNPTSVLELGSTSMVTPKGLYLVHLTKPGSKDYEKDLKETEEILFQRKAEATTTSSGSQPNVLWSLRFNHVDTSAVEVRQQTAPSNFLVTPGPGSVLDYDAAVSKARALFQIIAPDRSAEEFLPPAPNPEDIYVEEVQPTAPPTPNGEVAAPVAPAAEDGGAIQAEGPEVANAQPTASPDAIENMEIDADDAAPASASADS